uniref:Uncharacterized protein n=1 Tax=Arcella intermedia TaxID=1963864 RepID=A0A6B2LAD8_9EUKA
MLGSDDSVLSVNFSPNEELVLATCSSRSSWVWPIGSTKQDMRRCLTGHQSKVTCGQFTPNGDKAITGSHDRTLKIWDLQNRVCLKTFSATSAVHDLSVSRDGSFVVSGHQDCTVRFWDMRSGQMLADLSKIHSKLITGVSISPDGTKVLSLSRDFSLKIINSFTHEVELTIKHPKYRNAPKARGCWSPDGRLVAAGSEEGETFIWDGATGKCEATLKGDNPNPISQVTWNPSGIHLASADRAGYITLWG